MEALTVTIETQSYPVLELPGRPKALLDKTVAELFQTETRLVNRAVARNPEKFPDDFCFELTDAEVQILKSQIGISNSWDNEETKISHSTFVASDSRAFNRSNPKAFTHLGCNMLATILKSPIAIQRAILIIRAFTTLENSGLTLSGISKRLERLEQEKEYRLESYQDLATKIVKQEDRISHILRYIETCDIREFQIWQETKSLSTQIFSLRDTVTLSQAEIQRLDFLLKPLLKKNNMLLQEMLEIKKTLEYLDKKIHSAVDYCEMNAEYLDKKIECTMPISLKEAGELKECVKQKGKNRKNIFKIWQKFKVHFEIRQYQKLPHSRFAEALEWIKNWKE